MENRKQGKESQKWLGRKKVVMLTSKSRWDLEEMKDLVKYLGEVHPDQSEWLNQRPTGAA